MTDEDRPGRALTPQEHEAWNATHYPGTRQMCAICDEPTGRCEDDAIYTINGDTICEDCADEHPELLED